MSTTANNSGDDTRVYHTAHICTPCGDKTVKTIYDNTWIPPQLEITQDGSFARVRRERRKLPQVGGGIRGSIKGFSRQARRRMMDKLAHIRKGSDPLFITLTYPGEYSKDPEVWKDDLRKFCQRLKRYDDNAGVVWRLEFQNRGAPHFHLLAFGVSRQKMMRLVRCQVGDKVVMMPWLSVAWYETVGSCDIRHLQAGTQVQKMMSQKHLWAYISKEMAKVTQATLSGVGRWWGMIARNNIPWSSVQVIDITDRIACQMIRMFRRHSKLMSRSYKSLSVFLDGGFWISKLDRLLYDDTLQDVSQWT